MKFFSSSSSMNIKTIIRNTLIIVIIMLNVSCDQVTKSIVRKQLVYHDSITIIDNFLTLTKVENSGAFLSFGSSMPLFFKFVLLNLLPVLVLVYGIYILIQKKISKGMLLGFCFVIGGGAGNLYDRLRFGSVTDFLHLNFGLFQTGIFNMADVSIMVGMAIILFEIYSKKVVTYV